MFIAELWELEKAAMGFYYDEKRPQWDDGIADMDNLETLCHFCHKPFNIDHSDKVRDHDHVTRKYPGPAHKWCNLRLRRTCKVPVFFNNFRGYDSHFMALKDFEVVDIRVIGQGMEKYISLSLGKYLVFKGSLQFLGSSLATLSKNLLKTDLERFMHVPKRFRMLAAHEFRLIVRKGGTRRSIWTARRRWKKRNSNPRRPSPLR